jgi:hypothetical protein
MPMATGGEVATEARKRSLGHARASSVVEITNHGINAAGGLAPDGAEAALAVVEISIAGVGIRDHIAGSVVLNQAALFPRSRL